MGLKQLNFDLLNRTEVVIQRLKQYEPPEEYYLGFSGGKDSIVIYDIAVEKVRDAIPAKYQVPDKENDR